jgi:sulfatase modifying factor 1
MIKRMLICTAFLICQTSFAGNFFNVSATGSTGPISITLCLNGKGAISCQNYTVSALNLMISTTIPHNYPNAGIKILTSGYTLSGCMPNNNGYCLFSVSNTATKNIVISNAQYELVTIGNPGNASDPLTGFGAVNYTFRMGKYDVTIKQYTNFLNAVAKTDTYSLYNPSMGSDLNSAGISRSGASGNFSYSVMDNGGLSANRPITYVTWFNAARFANWMANGQPLGAQTRSTTENGTYALNGKTSGTAVAKNSINPNTGAAPTYYIPLENEWYKAAYYNPYTGTYFLYATQSNIAPGNKIGNLANQANYFIANGSGFSVTQSLVFLYGIQNYLTDVGAFSASGSVYGTFDQNGNADQWNDLDGSASLFRGLRGGFYFAGTSPLKSTLFAKSVATNAYNGGSFRLASPA